MRIISGSKKGHSIFSHKDKDVRPLSDKNRETIFKENDVKKLGFYFCIEILTVIFLAKLLNVDPFVQEAVELQKNNLS